MGWLIVLGILFFLAVLPLGVRIKYDSGGPLVRVILGPVKLTVFPRPKKQKKEKKSDRGKNGGQPEAAGAEPSLPEPPKPPAPEKEGAQKKKGGSLLDFLPLVRVALDFLGDFRRKLRIDNLYLRLILASSDPCDLAVNYGRAWAALGNLMPQLERLFKIKERDVEVECDFTASEPTVIARVDLTITLGRLLSLAAVYGIRALKEFLKLKKKRKGGAENESETSQHAGNNHSENP